MTFEIVLLALVALFVGLRLYAVLGQRTGHEQQPVTRPEAANGADPGVPASEGGSPRSEAGSTVYEDGAANGIRSLVTADPSFDVARFLDGAQAAYRLILESFWKGEREELDYLTGEDVRASFHAAIAAREEAGHTLDNRLIAIDRAVIEDARLEGRVASIVVRFDATIAAITRDENGEVIAGSLTDAIGTHDIWTFQRDLRADDPNWLLVETDEAA